MEKIFREVARVRVRATEAMFDDIFLSWSRDGDAIVSRNLEDRKVTRRN